MPDLVPRCPRCGEPLPNADASAACPRCAETPPPLPAIESWFEEPAQPPPLPPTTASPELVILDEPLEEVPLVKPTAKPLRPEPRPQPAFQPAKELSRPPVRRDEPIERPKPQIGMALVVILILTLATCGGAGVISYAIWAGFKRYAPKRADATLEVRPAPGLRGNPFQC